MADPLRMYLVVQRGAVSELAGAGELAGAAAVACVREPAFADAVAAWRPRPGKVCLRARTASQWQQVLEEPHVLAGDAVAALPPRRRSERGPLLERLQAMSTDLGAAPRTAPERPGAMTYLLNPEAPMSSGKTLAQIAHAAVMAADTGRFEDVGGRRLPGARSGAVGAAVRGGRGARRPRGLRRRRRVDRGGPRHGDGDRARRVRSGHGRRARRAARAGGGAPVHHVHQHDRVGARLRARRRGAARPAGRDDRHPARRPPALPRRPARHGGEQRRVDRAQEPRRPPLRAQLVLRRQQAPGRRHRLRRARAASTRASSPRTAARSR